MYFSMSCGGWRLDQDAVGAFGIELAQRGIEVARVRLRIGGQRKALAAGGQGADREQLRVLILAPAAVGAHHQFRACHQFGRRARRVVRAQCARHARAGRRGAARDRAAQRGADRLDADLPRAQDPRQLTAEVHDGRLDADRARAAIEHERKFVAELLAHMLRRGRADVAVAVGRGRRQAATEGAQHRQRERMRRYPDPDRVLATRHLVRDAGVASQDQGQRTRPEARSERARGCRNFARPLVQLRHVAQVHDHRMIERATLERIDPLQGREVGGVAREAVDGLGRQSDDLAASQGGDGGMGVGAGVVIHAAMVAASK